MKRIRRITAVLAAGVLIASPVVSVPGGVAIAADTQFAGEEWYDQIETVEVNREPARTSFTPYESAEKALANEKSALDEADETGSAWYQSLNGDWKFKFSQKPAEREKSARGEAAQNYTENWNTADWDVLQVPSSIQAVRDEDGDFKYEKPMYINTRYPWMNWENVDYNTNGKDSPVAPTVSNSVGHYKRTFTIPDDWKDRQTFVSFQGVESAFYLYVNGQRVGYAEDSYTADEFNITEYLKDGENTIAVEVYRWSTGSYLENQDFIRMSGIFRDVFLYSKDDVELRDYFVKTDLDENYENAELTLEADVRSLNPEVSGTYTVRAELYEQDTDDKVWDGPLTFQVEVEAGKATVEERADDKGQRNSATKMVVNPEKWFADTPNLYRLLIELVDGKGDVVETTCQRIGFREIEKIDINEAGQEQAQINGKKIMFRGVNRHETDHMAGRALTREDIREDLMLMKQFNVNAIRTSHYPNQTYTYALADELGIYICDEANIESHMGAQAACIPSGNLEWNNAVMDRTMNMVERDKNHASVVIWSLGNEAVYDPGNHPLNENYCFYNSTSWILERDPSRLRKCERDNRYTKGSREDSMVDIYSTQYWDVSSVENYVANTNNKAPYIQSEYAHAMGNGLGNFKEYWDIFRTYENGQGGFIWDWIDQSIATKIENRTDYYIKNPDGSQSAIEGVLKNGREGNGKALDGYVIVPNQSAGSSEITLAAWVKYDGSNEKDQAIISKGDDGYNLKITKDGNQLEFFVDGWKDGVLRAAFPSDKIGQWVYLAATYKDGSYKLYADGELLAEQSISKSTPVDSGQYSIGIGEDPEYSGRQFNGIIDGVQVLNIALSQDQADGTYVPKPDQIVYVMNFTEEEFTMEGTGGEERFYNAYGGDWGENYTDHDFCANGLVSADRTPSDELYEVKKVQQEISFYDDGEAKDGKVRIVNEFLNTNLNQYNIDWKFSKDNEILAEGSLSEEEKDIEAGAQKIVEVELPQIKAAEGSDYILAFSAALKENQTWAGAYSGHRGDEIAFEQFILEYEAETVRPIIDVNGYGKLDLNETEESCTVRGGNEKDTFSVTLDKTTGYITDYTVNGEVLLKEGPKPNYYRARISNDPEFTDAMKNAADNFALQNVTVDAQDKVVSIHVEGTISGIDSPNSIDYVIYANGDIIVTNTFTPANNENVGSIARIGMKMIVPEKYENVTYYGRGPQENYIDRNTGARLGVYKNTVTDMFNEMYLRPQENGNRTDVRWVTLTDGTAGTGIMVTAEETMEMGALHYTAEELNEVWRSYGHPYQLDAVDDVILTVDLAQRGLGNASCGPGPLGKYILNAGKTYTHTFRISAITEAAENEENFVGERMEVSRQNMQSTSPLQGITLNDVPMTEFDASVPEYTIHLLNKRETSFPKVGVLKTSEDVTVEITQPTAQDPTAVIRAVSPYGVEKVYTIHFVMEDQIFISDMEWLTDESGYSANQRDKCTCGMELGVWEDGIAVSHEKGVGSHAPSDVTVRVEGTGATDFSAIIGIGKEQEENGNVNFVVKVDGKEVFRKDSVEYKTSFPIKVDISGAKKLSLITETNGSDGNDHAVWADAKLTCGTDRASLKAAITEFEKLKDSAGDYTEASFAEYEKAYKSAVNAYEDPEISQQEADAAKAALSDAGEALVNVSGLKELIARVRQLKEDDYEEAAWNTLQQLNESAQALLITGTLQEVSEVTEMLKAAIKDTKEPVGKPIESISFDSAETSLIIGEGRELKVTVKPSDADNADKVEWSGSDGEVLTVDADGKIKALWPGEVTVTAKAGDKTADIRITVYGVEKIYNDVKDSDWFYNAVNWAYINDVMGGYGNGSFGPNDSLARAQFAVIMYRIAGEPEVKFKDRFPDVREGDWYADAVIWANDNNIITGYTATGMFGPADKITREQIATVLYRYAKAEGDDAEATDGLADFPDAEKVSGFAKDAMEWAVASGLIKGDGGKLNPQGNANRAEAAMLIKRFISVEK